jgi:hypothetical protein
MVAPEKREVAVRLSRLDHAQGANVVQGGRSDLPERP